MEQRIIKFRGFTPIKMYQEAKFAKPHWVYGYYIEYPKGQHIIEVDGERFVCDGDSIGQFCGLTDKNGKEIYEGDIGRWVDPYGNVVQSIGIVAWHCGGLWFCFDKNGKDAIGVPHDEWEVIGNIYENPELIK